MWDSLTASGTCENAVWRRSTASWSFRSPFQACVGAGGDLKLKTKENKPSCHAVTFPFTGKPFLTHLLPLMSPVSISNI